MTTGRQFLCLLATLFIFALISVSILNNIHIKLGFHGAGVLEAAAFRSVVSIRSRSSSRSFLELELRDFDQTTAPAPAPAIQPDFDEPPAPAIQPDFDQTPAPAIQPDFDQTPAPAIQHDFGQTPAPGPAPAIEPDNAPTSLPPLPYLPLCIDEHSPPLAKFVQPLSFPPAIDLSLLNGSCLTLSAFRTTQKFHPDLPPTTVYAYGTSLSTAATPGPTLLARRYVESCIRWENHIPDDWHFLPLAHNSTVDWANPRRGGVPIVTHLHGGEVAPIHDGNPDAWFTSRNETGPAFVTQNYVYPNRQNPMAIWYHDHTFGITRLNNLAGLSGLYIVRPTEDEERAIGLPEGIPLVLKDWRFFPNGSINLPGPADYAVQYWCPEWFDTWAVNGNLWPYANVSNAAYRFRLLLATNMRYVGLYLRGPGGRNLTMHQIGTDGGLLDEPMPIQNMMLFASDRVDFIVDFSEFEAGDEIFLMNFPLPLDHADEPFLESGTAVIMKFVVVSEGGLEDGIIRHPDYLRRLRAYLSSQRTPELNIIPESTIRRREISVNLLVNQTSHRGYAFAFHNLTWRDPVTIEPVDGSTEIWEIINVSNDPHSVHIHLIHFRVINQQRIDVDAYNNGTCSVDIPYPNNGTCFLDHPESPFPYQRGWKDNIIIWDAYVLRLLLQFTTREGEPFVFDPTGEPGYVFHCHILQHEDHIMMRPFKLQPKTYIA